MTGRPALIVALAGLMLLTGCQGGPGPLTSRYTTLGSLKTSVSQLEFQNEQLAKQVAELKSENRHFGDRLVQEEAENGDLAARLDDARNVLGQRGGDEPATTKVRRSGNTKRKPPAAAIPGRIEPSDDPDGKDVGLSDPPPRSRVAARPPRDDRWLPVARGLGSGRSAFQ